MPIEEEYVVRRVTADDLDAVVDLCRCADWPSDRNEALADIGYKQTYALFWRHAQTRPSGMPAMAAMASYVPQGTCISLSNVVSHPALRGRGISKYLVRCMLQQARSTSSAQGAILVTTLIAKPFYASLGFVESPVQVIRYVSLANVRLHGTGEELMRLTSALDKTYCMQTGDALSLNERSEILRLTAATSSGMDRSALLDHHLGTAAKPTSAKYVSFVPRAVIVRKRSSSNAIVGFAALLRRHDRLFLAFAVAPTDDVAKWIIASLAHVRDERYAEYPLKLYSIIAQDRDGNLGRWLVDLGFRDIDIDIDASTGKPYRVIERPTMELALRAGDPQQQHSSVLAAAYLHPDPKADDLHRPRQYAFTTSATL